MVLKKKKHSKEKDQFSVEIVMFLLQYGHKWPLGKN